MIEEWYKLKEYIEKQQSNTYSMDVYEMYEQILDKMEELESEDVDNE